MKEILSSYFENLEDPRSLRNQRHPLITLIGTSLLAALSGIDSFSGIQDFVDMHMDELKKILRLPTWFTQPRYLPKILRCVIPYAVESLFYGMCKQP